MATSAPFLLLSDAQTPTLRDMGNDTGPKKVKKSFSQQMDALG
jgi:hypothetical protein